MEGIEVEDMNFKTVVEELQLQLRQQQQLQVSDTLESGLRVGLQSFGEILRKQKKKLEQNFQMQLQHKSSENKRQLLQLHQREAELCNEQLHYIKKQETFHRIKQQALQDELTLHMLQLEDLKNHSEVINQRLRFHQKQLHSE